MLVVVTLGDELPHGEALLSRLARFPQLTCVVQNINPERGNRILGFENRTLQGAPAIRDSLDGLSFALSPLSFYQINPEQTQVLYREALRLAAHKLPIKTQIITRPVMGVAVAEEAES